MPLTTEAKGDIITQYQTHEGDTGSPEVQVAILTRRIKDLADTCPPTSMTITPAAAC